jgi:hypothetical protein
MGDDIRLLPEQAQQPDQAERKGIIVIDYQQHAHPRLQA